MGLETATFISELVDTNPVFNDKKRQGDDHLRLLKEVLQNTLPNASKAFYFPTTVAKTANFSVTAAEMNKTFMVSTGAGEVTATLPALAAGDDGWCCHFIKTNAATTAFFIAPASGTLTSGEVGSLAKCRRVIPGHRCTAMWDGTGWFVTRNVNAPIGAVLDLTVADLPVGFEWPNGQTLADASTKYPEFYVKNGNSGVVRDICGRVVAGKDDMGEASNNRLTGLSGGVNGDTLGAAGGAESCTLTGAESGQKAITAAPVDITDAGHVHGEGDATEQNRTPVTTDGNPQTGYWGAAPTNTASATTGITAALTLAASDAASPHNNVQPTIVLNKILVVE